MTWIKCHDGSAVNLDFARCIYTKRLTREPDLCGLVAFTDNGGDADFCVTETLALGTEAEMLALRDRLVAALEDKRLAKIMEGT